jgi:hypothetical protein
MEPKGGPKTQNFLGRGAHPCVWDHDSKKGHGGRGRWPAWRDRRSPRVATCGAGAAHVISPCDSVAHIPRIVASYHGVTPLHHIGDTAVTLMDDRRIAWSSTLGAFDEIQLQTFRTHRRGKSCLRLRWIWAHNQCPVYDSRLSFPDRDTAHSFADFRNAKRGAF